MRKIYRLIGLLVAIGFGWVLGTLCLPDFDLENQFVFGVSSGALLSLIAILLFNLVQRNLSVNKVSKRSTTWAKVIAWAAVLLLGVTAFYSYNNATIKSALLKVEEENSRQQKIQNRLEEAKRISDLYDLRMRTFTAKILEQRKSAKYTTLPMESIAQIIALSISLEPYLPMKNDSLASQKLSPERGELLKLLCSLEIDSASFKKIIIDGDFKNADLRGANLESIDVSGIDLRGANLEKANLKNADLSGSNLVRVILREATLDGAVLDDSEIKHLRCQWASLKEASLRNTNLKGADFSNSQMQGVDFHKAFLQWANMQGTILQDANFFQSDLYAVKFNKSNLQGANLERSRIRNAEFIDADLLNVNLLNAAPGPDWFIKLPSWNATGAEEITSTYKLVKDSIQYFNYEKYLLKK